MPSSIPLRFISLSGCRREQAMPSSIPLRFISLSGCRKTQAMPFIALRAISCRAVAMPSSIPLRFISLSSCRKTQAMPSSIPLRFISLSGCRPIILKKKSSTLESKLSACNFLFRIAWLVAYAKYLFNNPSKALPCLASSLAISCTVSWIASRLAAFARFARSNLPLVAPFSASTRI